MSEKNQSIFIDFGSSKLRLGAFNQENLKNIFILEEDCTSNFGLKNFDIEQSNEIFKKDTEADKVMNKQQKDNLKNNKLYTKLMKELSNYY